MKHLVSFLESLNDDEDNYIDPVCDKVSLKEYYLLTEEEIDFSPKESSILQSLGFTFMSESGQKNIHLGECDECDGPGDVECVCDGTYIKYKSTVNKIKDGYYMLHFTKRGTGTSYFKIDGFQNLIDYLKILKFVIEGNEDLIPKDFPDDDFVSEITG